MKALVTGVGGFVGKYLTDELKNANYETVGSDLQNADVDVDLLNYTQTYNLIKSTAPSVIFHLAGQSSVGVSWKKPQLTFDVNIKGTINLLEAVREVNPKIRILIIGSSEEYGKVSKEDCPIKETLTPKPQNPYAVSKYAQEQMALLYAKAYNLDVVLTRSFNHTGPTQPTGFVIPDFATQIVEIERGGTPQIFVGNLEAKRDISDVRDIVHGYRLLAQKGRSGEIYNIGSANAYSIAQLLNMLIEISAVKPEVIVDKAKLRPIETPLIVCDIAKLQADTGYKSSFSIKTTLEDILNYRRSL